MHVVGGCRSYTGIFDQLAVWWLDMLVAEYQGFAILG